MPGPAEFPCTACGECCRRVGQAEETRHLADDSGVCRFYDTDRRLCRIYEDRPDICRIDRFYKTHLQGRIERRRYYEANAYWCNSWQEEVGLPTDYRVVIE